MASLIYNSAIDDMVRGLIDFDTDTFKAMLVTADYTPSKDTHDKLNDVTNEASGTGYTSGGISCGVTVTKSNENDNVTIQFAELSWPNSAITARGCVYYKSRGGAASLDELVAYNDFPANIVSSPAVPTFSVGPTTITVAMPPQDAEVIVPVETYSLTVSSGIEIQAEPPLAVEGPLIIEITSNDSQLNESPTPVNAYYDGYVISATYSGAEMATACGGLTSAFIVGMRIDVTSAPSAVNQPFPGYVIGAKNTANSVTTNNTGTSGGTFTQVYGPGIETFTTGEVKEFLFSAPIVWTGGNFAFVWAWNDVPDEYTSTGWSPAGAGTTYWTGDAPPYTVNSPAGSESSLRPVFKLLYTS